MKIFLIKLAVYLNTTGVRNIFWSVHNRGMFDPSPRANYGSDFNILKLHPAGEEDNSTGERKVVRPLHVLTKTLQKRLPGRPWDTVMCRDREADGSETEVGMVYQNKSHDLRFLRRNQYLRLHLHIKYQQS